jgi:hypothetical protein
MALPGSRRPSPRAQASIKTAAQGVIACRSQLTSALAACALLGALCLVGTIGGVACGEPPAPYTDAALLAIDAGLKQTEPPKPPPDLPMGDRIRALVEWYRAGYRAAGYDFDATLLRACNDFLHTRAGEGPAYLSHLWMIHSLMRECKTAKVDCLAWFAPELAEAIRQVLAVRRPPQ